MSATFLLTLDTTPPVVTWGAATGTSAGSFLSVPFEVDEPELVSAEAVLLDGRHLAMAVETSAVEVLLPDDAPGPSLHIQAVTLDDAGNEGVSTITVPIDSPIQAPEETPPPRTGGFPGATPARRAPAPRVSQYQTGVGVTTTYSTEHAVTSASSAGIRSTTTVTRRDAPVPTPPTPTPTPAPPPRIVATSSTMGITTAYLRSSDVVIATGVGIASTTQIERRDDGELIAVLVAAGLI